MVSYEGFQGHKKNEGYLPGINFRSDSWSAKKSTLETIVQETITSLRLPDHTGALHPNFLTTALGQLLRRLNEEATQRKKRVGKRETQMRSNGICQMIKVASGSQIVFSRLQVITVSLHLRPTTCEAKITWWLSATRA